MEAGQAQDDWRTNVSEIADKATNAVANAAANAA